MSFTVAVKEEILGQHHLSWHELSAIIKMSGSIGLSTSGLTLSVVTENAKLARHLYESFLHFYEIKSEIRHHQRSNLRKNRVYTVFTDEKVQDLLSDLHLADSFFGLKQVLMRRFYRMRKQVVPISVALSWQMGAFVTLSQASTSWKSVLFIWTTRKELPPFSNSFYWMPRCLSARRGL